MKKILLALAVLAVAAATSFAGVGINWYAEYGVYDHNALDLSGATGDIGASFAVTWQLIYAGANNAADLPGTSLGGAGIADDYVTGDDVVWGSRTVPVGGGLTAESGDGDLSFDTWLLADGGVAADMVYENLAWNTAGFVYQRIYENPVQANAWFFQTDLVALNTSYTGGGQTPDTFLVDGGVGIQPDQQVAGAPVPEPATMALLGLGALTMAIRRRRA